MRRLCRGTCREILHGNQGFRCVFFHLSATAYTDKIKEMSMLSLLCSCFYTQPHPNSLYQYGDLEVKGLNKRESGQSFELILKDPNQFRDKPQPQPLPSPPKKEVSLEELQKRLEAAEERRKSQEALVLKQLAEKREHEQEVLHKLREENNNFSRKTEEKLIHKMEVNKENREAHLKALKQRLHMKATQSERGSDQCNTSEPLGDLWDLDLKTVCHLCSVKEKEITYTVKSVIHTCSRNQLLVKAKASNVWRPVSERPTHGNFGQNVLYKVCNFYVEGSGCTQHGGGCTYARSCEEASVWNYVREKKIDIDEVIRLVTDFEHISVTPESAAESILQEFSGEFIELCKDCFHDHPQKLTTKKWNATCSADEAHTWNPVLVYHISENNRKHIYSEVRPLPQNCQFKYCSHVKQGKPCWHQAGHCASAQSEVEMAVWKAEQSGLSVRPHVLQLSQQKQTQPRQVTMYCKVCLLVLSSPESFFKHCSSLEHAQLLSDDTTTKWRGRQPPHNRRAEFWLCKRPQTCEYGNNCPKAHSMEELQEWMMRTAEEKEIRCNIEAQGYMSYNERLLEEYKNSSNEVHVLSENVDDVSLSCDKDLTVECEQIDATLQWNFQVETERQLVHVALLKQEPGASFTLNDITLAPCSHSRGEHFLSEDMTYDITVSFTCINPGLYEQWLVLDFGMRPVLLKKLRVRVGQPLLDDTEQPTMNHGAVFQSVERWHRGNRVIIPCSTRTEEQEELLKEYKPPQINFQFKSSYNNQTPLNHENYKESMHHFLYKEEQAVDQVVSSSADLYVRDHFHPFIDKKNDKMSPVRIKAKWSSLSATDEITLKYCFLSKDRQYFLPPTKAVLDHHKIVITTATMARYFLDLRLPEGYFTHILINEASQMLECEALVPLDLAGPNTRVVLAGDHMQMGPKLFSVDDHHRSNHTLLNRLFHYYQDQMCDAAQKSRIIFSENYRSTQEIVEFVSTHFYVGKNDVIKASKNIPAPANGHALSFHHVRGECLLDTVSMSWYNKEEVAKVVETVKEILEHWPSTWNTKDQSSICVLSEGFQVRQIRTALKRRQLAQVHVENLANIQGRQFRAIIMTAVQTRDSLKTSHLPGLELFDDARVFNTAMTRAQSQVVVIGDAAALCCFGKCSGIWKSYIEHCINNSSVAPQHFTKDFFEKDVTETARFQKSVEHVDESSTLSDSILQELKDASEHLKTEYSSDEDLGEFQDLNPHKSVISTDADVLELCKKQPEIYKQGKLIRESYNRGYVIPYNSPTRHISLNGRANLGKAFSGDEVVLQTARVVSVTKKAESARVLVCLLEDEDYSKPRQNSDEKFVKRLMMPITKAAPKVCILINKRRRNFLPIWEQIDEEWTVVAHERLDEKLKQNNVFIVQVIGWKDQCLFPLGKVTDILPIGRSLVDGLTVLNEEFKVARTPYHLDKSFSLADEDRTHRQDIREVITFTVDPEGAKDLDDAISVTDIGDQYELGVHIADVASFVSLGGKLDEDAKQCGATHYCSKEEPIHMFPQELSTGRFSLLEGQDRRVVSLMFKVNKQTHEITEIPKFQLSLIKSNRQLSYEDAEDMISKRCGQRPKFDTVADCVAVAHCFAKAQRKRRLRDWAYAQPDDHRLPGKRKAHLMIEELSVLFNKHTSETLTSSEKSRNYTPLRCQAALDPEKVQDFKQKCGEFIPHSLHVRHHVTHEEQIPNCENFRILTEVWKNIQSAARTDDIERMVDLVAADDIHPLLQPVISQFRKCFSKAYIIRSNSSPKAEVGHYSLNLKYYTQASSPIRRYMDIVLQRLLHSFICDRDVQYTRTEIMTLCNEFEHNLKEAKEYEQKAEKISYAVSMKQQSATKLAFVVSAEPNRDSFAVSFPFNKNIFSESLAIMYNDLQLDDQPSSDEANRCITLKWKRRIYAADTMQIHQELKMLPDYAPCVELPLTTWKDIVDAIAEEKWDCAKSFIIEANAKQLEKQKTQPEPSQVLQPETNSHTSEEDHYVEFELQLQPGDTLQIQMTSEVRRGFHMPAIQLVNIKSKFEVCVDHVHSPITCFARCADDPSRIYYSDTKEYVRIWKPLCKMESAATAVGESDSIIIENLVVNFNQEQEGTLTGSFFLPLAWISEWAIECDLSKCLLCIRKRGLKLTTTLEHSAQVDPRKFTWVAHAVTTKVEEKNKNSSNGGLTVNFSVNHLPMQNIPDCVFQKDTHFTVEIIPKLLPDIRKEEAVNNIPYACDLVKSIALGKHIPKEVKITWHIMRKELPDGLPKLNLSQRHAVDKALNDTFTVIQGPPEYLLRFGDSLRPLRVYSQQVEMLDYPYPDCTLQFSHRSFRQERAKQELRSITLHHRMRQKENPYSDQIRKFDQMIQLALQKKGEQLTAQQVKEYKNLLRAARKYELERHDIILCTCTQSSTPSLTKTVSARQILIDECAMATEPQALIPLVCNNPEKIVLIGDHKQLRPIVKNEHVRKLGMAKSLFERYYTIHEKRAVMLDTQYRMHEDICEFPSTEYYDGKLKTGVEQPNSVLRVGNRTMPIVFGHIQGETVRLVVNTAKGNENSKANRKERDKVIEIAEMLVKKAKVEQQSIVILSPYNAQVSEIRDELKKKNMDQITITTITKSQGSEWRYVILSTVCSLPSDEIQSEPDRAWLSKHLGFVGDPNQINVGITRAKEGLCIIGNQELLNCSGAWKKLLRHYRFHNAVTDAEKISVQGVPGS
ncbi:hypothetical protein PAMP_017989 [Pampus punctatissimus]